MHFAVTIHGRRSGANPTQAAAYRSGSKLVDEPSPDHALMMAAAYRSGSRIESTGQVFDYREKGQDHVAYSVILAPEGCPERLLGRQALWSEVSHAERRRDAQLYREVTLTVPTSLSEEARIELATEFATKHWADKGFVVDLNYHAVPENPHFHLMTTLRPIHLETGTFGKKEREWGTHRDRLKFWRHDLAAMTNRYLIREGCQERVTALSFKDRGLNLEPMRKNRRGSRKVDEHNNAVKLRNGAKLLHDPEIAVKALGQTREAPEAFAKRHSLGSHQYKLVLAAVTDALQRHAGRMAEAAKAAVAKMRGRGQERQEERAKPAAEPVPAATPAAVELERRWPKHVTEMQALQRQIERGGDRGETRQEAKARRREEREAEKRGPEIPVADVAKLAHMERIAQRTAAQMRAERERDSGRGL